MKRHAARAVLCVAALWPAVTLLLQRRYDVDPWKLMGFGMYATVPRRPADLGVFPSVRVQGEWRPAALDVAKFRGERQALGALVSVEPLLEQLLARPGAEAARVVLRAPRLDAALGRVRIDEQVFERVR